MIYYPDNPECLDNPDNPDLIKYKIKNEQDYWQYFQR